MHNNYFLQVQTLINQKAIGAPANAREDSKPAPEEKPDIEHEVKPDVVHEKNTKEVTCLNCGKTFTAARSTRLYCSGACKTAYNRKEKDKE